MKRQLLLPFIIYTISLFGQQTTIGQTTSSAEIKFEKTAHSFGVTPKYSKCTYEFKFKNIGSEPLILYCDGRTNCGCTIYKCPKKVIPPGQSGVIIVKYDSTRIGTFTKHFQIRSNAKTALVTLIICGHIYNPDYPVNYPPSSYLNCDCGQKINSSTQEPLKKVDSLSSIPITIRVYPNPFLSQTTIQSDSELINATLAVYNLSGQQVKEIKNISGQTVILLHRDNLISGLYFIQLTQDSKVIGTEKILISD